MSMHYNLVFSQHTRERPGNELGQVAVSLAHILVVLPHGQVIYLAYRYNGDTPHIEGELYAGLVMGTRPHARITVDYSEAVKMDGVRAYVGAQDVPGSNVIGSYSCVCSCIGGYAASLLSM